MEKAITTTDVEYIKQQILKYGPCVLDQSDPIWVVYGSNAIEWHDRSELKLSEDQKQEVCDFISDIF